MTDSFRFHADAGWPDVIFLDLEKSFGIIQRASALPGTGRAARN